MAAPVNTVAPSFTGTLRVGQTLTGADGTWDGAPTFAYQWQCAEIVRDADGQPVTDGGEIVTLDWADIAGAASSTYLAAIAAVTKMVRYEVTGTNVDGSTIAYSAQAGPLINRTSPQASIAGAMYSRVAVPVASAPLDEND